MRRDCTRVGVCAALATLLVSCAMPGRAPYPEPSAEPVTRGDGYRSRKQITEPQTIAAWEARLESHAATLNALLPATGGGTITGGGTTTGGGATTRPTGPAPRTHTYSPGTGPSPGRAPARATARPPSQATTIAKRSIRCRRICRHVRAICYAATRICQIAARVGGQYARAACRRSQNRCRTARSTRSRHGCTSCGTNAPRR